MANEEHLKILRKGVKAWNAWRIKFTESIDPKVRADLGRAVFDGENLCRADLKRADLIAAHLRGANLSEADLSEAYLVGAELRQADLSYANLRGAMFRGADLHRANLRGASLMGADFRQANLSEARLSGACLSGANLSSADLNNARVGYTDFGSLDLSEVKSLKSILHEGPSTIGIDTVYRSMGKIPFEFLRGAGVPDNFIEYMDALVGTSFEFYSCFISYSTKDQEFADRLYEGLQNNSVRCWFAPHDAHAGKKLHEQIDSAIRMHERLLLILSPTSIHSEWVKTEIAKARKREVRESKRVLFPIMINISYKELQDWECFDADTGKDSAREIREYYIPDFTNWKDHNVYQKEFPKLLRDLKKADAGAETMGKLITAFRAGQ